MEKAEALSTEIQTMKHQVYILKQLISKKTIELHNTCPHTNVREEFDDDFHKPHRYYVCLTCNKQL
jgi:transcription initiation factor IIE alpha subunit